MARAKAWPWLVATLLTSGCVGFDYRYTPEQEQRLLAEILGSVPETEPVSPLYLSDEAKQELDRHIHRRWGDARKLDELRSFLFDEDKLDLTYSADDTRTAMQLWRSHRGNCLSMTNLFVAAARYVGIDANYETVEVRPTWDQQGSTMVRYEHIIAVGKLDSGREYVVDFLPEFVIGGRKATRITDRQATALYYNNLGAESVIDGDYKKAVDNLVDAIRINGRLSDAWNNIGAALRRNGQDDLAEFAYQRAVHLDTDNYSALSNLAQFYQSKGREPEARYFVTRVNGYRRRNPYYHYFIAHHFFEQGEYRKAIVLLDQAIQLKRDEPEFYDALAKSWDKLGNTTESHRYAKLADRYRAGISKPPPREHNHRFWIQNIRINN